MKLIMMHIIQVQPSFQLMVSFVHLKIQRHLKSFKYSLQYFSHFGKHLCFSIFQTYIKQERPYLMSIFSGGTDYRYSVANNIMNRDIILRTATSQKSDTQSVKLIDSRGKKANTSKISIYSQKYTTCSNPVQRQELKIYRANDKKLPEVIAINSGNPNIRQAIVLQAKREQSQPKQMFSQQVSTPSTTAFQYAQYKEEKAYMDASLANAFKEHIQTVRIYYEGKIKQILQENARVISELRNLLIQQQHKIAQKQEQISKILLLNQNKIANIRPAVIRIQGNESPQRARVINANASYEYLCNKVKDLDVNIKCLMQQFGQSEDEIKAKLQKVENGCIRYFAEKLGNCWFKLSKFIQNIQTKCKGFENYLVQLERNPSKGHLSNDIDSYYRKISTQIRQKMDQLSQDIRNFSKKQYKYENERLQNLQSVLIDLLTKFGHLQKRNSLHGSRRVDNGYFLQDEDEFFYPSTDRKVYETNDDYEHFQSSDDERPNEIKQNINDNMPVYFAQKSKKF